MPEVGVVSGMPPQFQFDPAESAATSVGTMIQQKMDWLVETNFGDRIKGLKLLRIDAHCGGAAVHEVPP